VIVYVGGYVGQWASLDGITIYTKGAADALELPAPWVKYERGFMDPSYMRIDMSPPKNSKKTRQDAYIVQYPGMGLCFFFGLMRINNWAIGDWADHLATIPKECRPSHRLVFAVNQHENTLRVDITPEGMVVFVSGMKKHAWVSLDGIQFMTHATNPLNLYGDWKPYSATHNGTDQRDPVWHRTTKQLCVLSGVVRASSDPHPIIAQLHPDCRPTAVLTFGVIGEKGECRLDVTPNGKLMWRGFTSRVKPPMWISLDGIKFVVP